MKWRLCTNYKENHICIVCEESILIGQRYIRPHFDAGAGGLNKPLSPPHKTTWTKKRPYFHFDCFINVRKWFESSVTVYELKDNERQNVPL